MVSKIPLFHESLSQERAVTSAFRCFSVSCIKQVLHTSPEAWRRQRTRCLLFLLHRSGTTDNPQGIITVSQDLAGQHSDDWLKKARPDMFTHVWYSLRYYGLVYSRSLYLDMSGNGEQPQVDLFIVLQCVLCTHICNDGQDSRHIGIVHTQNDWTVAVDMYTEQTSLRSQVICDLPKQYNIDHWQLPRSQPPCLYSDLSTAVNRSVDPTIVSMHRFANKHRWYSITA